MPQTTVLVHQPSLEDLVSSLATAKAAEELAKQQRIKFEELVAAKVGGPEEGQKTFDLEDGTKITVTRGFNFAADCEAICALFRREQLDTAPPVATKTTMKLDEPAYKAFASRFPSVYEQIAKHVTVTLKKISVVLKAPKA